MADNDLIQEHADVNIFGPDAPRETRTAKQPSRPAPRAAEVPEIEADDVDQSLFVNDKEDATPTTTPIKKALTKRNMHVYTKTEEAAKAGLEMLARQHFITTLDRRLYEKPVKAIFIGMGPSNPIPRWLEEELRRHEELEGSYHQGGRCVLPHLGASTS